MRHVAAYLFEVVDLPEVYDNARRGIPDEIITRPIFADQAVRFCLLSKATLACMKDLSCPLCKKGRREFSTTHSVRRSSKCTGCGHIMMCSSARKRSRSWVEKNSDRTRKVARRIQERKLAKIKPDLEAASDDDDDAADDAHAQLFAAVFNDPAAYGVGAGAGAGPAAFNAAPAPGVPQPVVLHPIAEEE